MRFKSDNDTIMTKIYDVVTLELPPITGFPTDVWKGYLQPIIDYYKYSLIVTFIGDFSSEQECYSLYSRQLKLSIFEHVYPYINLYEKNTFKIDVNTSKTIKVDDRYSADNFTMNEQSVIDSDGKLPNIAAGESGIDNPSQKHRGRHSSGRVNNIATSTPEYYKHIIEYLDSVMNVPMMLRNCFEQCFEEFNNFY